MTTSRRPSSTTAKPRSGGDPFGNLGKTDWGLPTLMAVGLYSVVYGLAKFGGQWCPFPLDIVLQLLAVVLGASVAETAYAAMTSGLRTSGFHRFFVCFTGALIPAFVVHMLLYLVLVGFDDVGIVAFAALLRSLGWALVSSIFGMFWLSVLDRMKGEVI